MSNPYENVKDGDFLICLSSDSNKEFASNFYSFKLNKIYRVKFFAGIGLAIQSEFPSDGLYNIHSLDIWFPSIKFVPLTNPFLRTVLE